jgi:tetratricopeptide (TPR) repeat protein
MIPPAIEPAGRDMRNRHSRRQISIAVLVLVLAWPASCQETSAAKPSTGDTSEAHLGKGYEALKQDNYDGAVSEFKAALALDPTLVLRARFPMAVALFESHKSGEARREFEAVRGEVGDHPNILYYLGRLDLEDNNIGGAIQNLNKAAAKPPFPDTAYYLGFAYFKKGDLTAAEKWLNEAAQLNPQDSRVQYQLGVVYRKGGREEDARKAMARSKELRQGEDNESKLKLECSQKLDQGQRDEARAICQQLYDPNDAKKLTALGTIYGQHGDLEDALKPLRRAAELEPHAPQMQYNVALAYYQLNQFEAARAPLANALKRWPDLFQLNSLYGAVLLKLGEDLPGYQALRHAHQLNPDDSGTADLLYVTTLGLARKSQNAKRYSDSLRYLEEAAQLRPREPEPHLRMAEVYTLTARTAEASAEQREAARLGKNSVE